MGFSFVSYLVTIGICIYLHASMCDLLLAFSLKDFQMSIDVNEIE